MSRLAGLKNILTSTLEMSSSRHRADEASNFPTVPGTLNANDHELQERYHFGNSDDDMAPNTAPYYTPYLGLRARLSQVWINKWTILLLLILVRVLLAIRGLDHDIANAKVQALSACSSVENVGSAMASMPHYMSSGVNVMAAKGVEVAVEALMSMLMLSVTAVEGIALFIINLLTSTYVCLITLVVGGAMSAALEVIEKAGEFLNKTLTAVTGEIEQVTEFFTDGLNKVVEEVWPDGGLPGFLGEAIGKPEPIDLSAQLNKLKAISLDSDALSKDLQELQGKIPTFDQVHNFTNTMIRTPFEFVKKQINESTIGYNFDQSVFPVAEKQALSFCSENNGINDFFDGLSSTATTARKVFLGVIIALAVLVCVPMAWREIKRWRIMQQRAQLIRKSAFDPLDVIYLASRPYTSTAGIKVASRFGNTRRQILVRWFVAYITSVPALFVLLLGIAGLLSCLFQYILLRQVEAETPALAAQVGAFTGTVVTALTNASEQWAVGANSVIKSTNDEINSDVFGWVNTTTTSVNETLSTFVDGTQKVLNDTFGGTILYNPIQETLRCLIFLKVEGIQKALTWVHENANVAFPEFDKEIFSLGAAASLDDSGESQTFLSSPGSEAADDITGAVLKLTDFMKEAIEQEVYISLALLAIYMIIVFIGLGRVLVGCFGRDKTRAEGGPTYVSSTGTYTGETRTSPRNRGSEFPKFGEDVAETPWTKTRNENAEHFPSTSFPGEKRDVSLGQRGMARKEVPVERVRRVDGHVRKSSYGVVNEKSSEGAAF